MATQRPSPTSVPFTPATTFQGLKAQIDQGQAVAGSPQIVQAVRGILAKSSDVNSLSHAERAALAHLRAPAPAQASDPAPAPLPAPASAPSKITPQQPESGPGQSIPPAIPSSAPTHAQPSQTESDALPNNESFVTCFSNHVGQFVTWYKNLGKILIAPIPAEQQVVLAVVKKIVAFFGLLVFLVPYLILYRIAPSSEPDKQPTPLPAPAQPPLKLAEQVLQMSENTFNALFPVDALRSQVWAAVGHKRYKAAPLYLVKRLQEEALEDRAAVVLSHYGLDISYGEKAVQLDEYRTIKRRCVETVTCNQNWQTGFALWRDPESIHGKKLHRVMQSLVVMGCMETACKIYETISQQQECEEYLSAFYFPQFASLSRQNVLPTHVNSNISVNYALNISSIRIPVLIDEMCGPFHLTVFTKPQTPFAKAIKRDFDACVNDILVRWNLKRDGSSAVQGQENAEINNLQEDLGNLQDISGMVLTQEERKSLMPQIIRRLEELEYSRLQIVALLKSWNLRATLKRVTVDGKLLTRDVVDPEAAFVVEADGSWISPNENAVQQGLQQLQNHLRGAGRFLGQMKDEVPCMIARLRAFGEEALASRLVQHIEGLVKGGKIRLTQTDLGHLKDCAAFQVPPEFRQEGLQKGLMVRELTPEEERTEKLKEIKIALLSWGFALRPHPRTGFELVFANEVQPNTSPPHIPKSVPNDELPPPPIDVAKFVAEAQRVRAVAQDLRDLGQGSVANELLSHLPR